ncbi:hypothetical protein [Streptantibioticus ferralitis]|uniref:Transposase n=1 Tax=Streptantibioticus ferralitis TaxID=236510 RepID=A0ABT5Z572_9ACTN|nr:hypothetical protein [Streptantibioticus ferralitis]MDF2258959.1 hypothetical protein [Streptantibioticus ferralitis]
MLTGSATRRELISGSDRMPLVSPFSSGAVEEQVNRIKMLKRQMFGRAGIDLLRKRALLAG